MGDTAATTTAAVAPRKLPRDLPSLTSLRWYAALVVFLFHVNDVPVHWRLVDPFAWGYVGVAFFFVLSGFVLTWAAGPTVAARGFYWRRFARIYPSHLAMFLVVALVAAIAPSAVRGGAVGALMQMTLTQAWWPGYSVIDQWNGVSWSLSAEAFFYLCFPLLIVWFRRLSIRASARAVAAMLGAGVVALLVLRTHGLEGAGTAYFNPLARLPEFLLGMWLATAALRGEMRARMSLWWPIALVAVLAVVSWRKLLPWYPLADYVMLPGFALLIAVAATRNATGRDGALDRVLRHRVSVWLGEVSFAFYLVHRIVMAVLWRAAGWRHPWALAGGVGMFAATFVACLAAAALLHHGVERPARSWLMRRVRG